MSEQLQNVAVVGSLLAANFTVTVISREASSKTFPSNVTVKKVDFQSQSSLTAALQGQDALVSAIGTMATGEQKTLVAAVVEARVKRFIPSEYGLNTRTVGSETKLGKMLGSKIKTVDLLIEQAEMNPWFGWTALANNLFFDWSLKSGYLGVDIPSKTATIVDSGNEPWSTTNLDLIGRAIVAILQRPTETKNKYLMISSFTTSQNELLAAVEEETGVKFTITRQTAAQAEVDGDRNFNEGQAYKAFWDFVHQYQFADGAGHALAETESANELLGLEGGDLKSSVKKVVSLF